MSNKTMCESCGQEPARHAVEYEDGEVFEVCSRCLPRDGSSKRGQR